MPMFTIRELSS